MNRIPEDREKYLEEFRASIEVGERLVKGKGKLLSPILMDARGIDGHLVLLENGVRIKRSDPMVFLDKGIRGDKEIPFHRIESVQIKKASSFSNGHIRLLLLEGKGLAEPASGNSQDEYKVLFKPAQQSNFEEIKRAIEEKVTAAKMAISSSPRQAAPQAISYIDELEKLASLKDRGIISEEEFTAKKRQILGI
ncbi:MAG: SHOCT domain-containing protein [Dehalococcoidales bacterium]